MTEELSPELEVIQNRREIYRIEKLRYKLIDRNKILQVELSRKQEIEKMQHFIPDKDIVEELKIYISKKHRIGVEEVINKSRKKEFMPAKREFCFKLYTNFGFGYQRIGDLFGYRHHAIMHLVKTYKQPEQ